MKRLVLFLSVVSATLCSSGIAQTPRSVVARYCFLETHGALLDSTDPNMKLIDKLLINEDEAGYDTATIVRSYRIKKSSVVGKQATVIVAYENLGTTEYGGFMRKSSTEYVEFHLALTRHGWKIDGLRQAPHVLATVMIDHLQRLMSGSDKANKDTALKSEIDQLKRW